MAISGEDFASGLMQPLASPEPQMLTRRRHAQNAQLPELTVDYIISAIKVKKAATSGLDLVNGPYIGFDTARVDYPRLHIVKHDLCARGVEYALGQKAFEYGFIRLIALDDDPDDLRTILDTLEMTFNATPTTLCASTGAILAFVRRTPWSIGRNPVLSKVGLAIYQGFAEFEFNYQF